MLITQPAWRMSQKQRRWLETVIASELREDPARAESCRMDLAEYDATTTPATLGHRVHEFLYDLEDRIRFLATAAVIAFSRSRYQLRQSGLTQVVVTIPEAAVEDIRAAERTLLLAPNREPPPYPFPLPSMEMFRENVPAPTTFGPNSF